MADNSKKAPKGSRRYASPKRQSAHRNDPDALRGYYRQMALIRAFELRAAEMYTKAKIGGYCHLNLGEEATVVGLMAALRDDDYLFTSYRAHGYALARGVSPERLMAELFGKATGVSGGWGGSMHLFDAKLRLLGGYGIVGGQIPPATGAALAVAYRDEGGSDTEAVMCIMGDGATNIGAFHESLNLASLWNLPIVYVIVNNGLGMGTPVSSAAAEPELYKRGCSYRMPGSRVDGNDVLAVREAAASALDMARAERRPSILEAVSYRLKGHSVVDPARYRSKDDNERLRRMDPLPIFRSQLIDTEVLDRVQAAAIDGEVDDAVSAAVRFAEESPFPSVDRLFANAYANPLPGDVAYLPGQPVAGG